MNDILKLHPSDNVGIATRQLAPGESISALSLIDSVPFGHKVALEKIEAGDVIRKYGQPIGVSTTIVRAGEHLHVHNLAFKPNPGAINEKKSALAVLDSASKLSFQGYLRKNGKVGTRNFIGVMATVNCSATVVAKIAKDAEYAIKNKYPNIDGVVPIIHQSGCGIPASTQSELSLLQRLLRGYINNPNFHSWLVVGLGCEVNQIDSLLGDLPAQQRESIKSLTIQESGGTALAIQKGLALVNDLAAQASTCQRSEQPLSKLTLGLQCGGSDAWSGVSANPALGIATDLLVAQGGSAILAETPEIFGAEQLLYARASSEAVAEKLKNQIAWWGEYVSRAGTDLNNNPSPGNLKGGITTILEKSLGAVAKSGQASLNGVLEYAEPLTLTGLNFMDSPGFDPCSITGEIASGANIICFTTGRGSTFGAAGAPCLKLASNSALYQRMQDDMDINCGAFISDDIPLAEKSVKKFSKPLSPLRQGHRQKAKPWA